MDSYNRLYFQVVAPLVHVATLDDDTKALEAAFVAVSVRDHVWDNSIIKNRLLNPKYIVKVSSADPDTGEVVEKDQHSALSPFNVDSDLFPNGILSHRWFDKYVSNRPFAVVKVFSLAQPHLADVINEYRAKYSIKFIAVVVSHTPNPDDDNDAVSTLRTETKLPKLTGLYYLNLNPATVDRDSELVVTTLLANLRSPALDFYSSIEHKIKQRGRKYYTVPSHRVVETAIELTPKFLETRNLIKQGIIGLFASPHDLEPSLKPLELAYQNLIDLLDELFAPLGTVSDHDLQLYFQLRNLIDVVAFHITRGYFSLEEPVLALRKHATHVINVMAVLDTTDKALKDINDNWVSVQYRWLVELMAAIPASIHNVPLRGKTKLRTTVYFGGVKFNDNFPLELTTNPGLILLKAAQKIPEGLVSSKFDYLYTFKSAEEADIQRLTLLKSALEQLTREEIPLSYSMYVTWMVAEEYFKVNDIAHAIEYYEKCLTDPFASKLIYEKLHRCYVLNKDYEKLLVNVVNGDLWNDVPQEIFENIDTCAVTDQVKDFFAIHALVTNEQIGQETHVFDPCVVQLLIDATIKNSVDIEVDLQIDNLEVKFTREKGPGKVVEIIHDGSKENRVFSIVDKSANLSVNDQKILQFKVEFDKAGVYSIESIRGKSTIKLSRGGKTIILTRDTEFAFKHSNHNATFYVGTGAATLPELERKQLRLRNPSHKVRVLSLKPDITAEVQLAAKCHILGEKISLPVNITYNQKQVVYKQLSLQHQVKVIGFESDISPQVNWDELKDDEPLNLSNLTEGGTQQHILNLTIHDSPNKKIVLGEDSKIVIGLLSHVVEESGDDEDTVYEVAEFVLPIIGAPFEASCQICPRYRTDAIDMPSPFILNPGANAETLGNDQFSMPIARRLWVVDLSIQDLVFERTGEQLEIVAAEVSLKTKNPELVIETVDGAVVTKGQICQQFSTKSKNGFSHRNAAVLALASIQWKRKDQSSTFQTKEWEIVLPLSDPRVLVNVADGDHKTTLQYILENPTPRIFTFTTQLMVDDAENWKFDDNGICPFKQEPFPVLPFSRHVLEYSGVLEVAGGAEGAADGGADDNWTRLPLMKVYDVQYKVGLVPLSVSDRVVAKDKELYYKGKSSTKV